MSRVIHVRARDVAAADRESMRARFADLVATREWRGGTPWLADSGSPELLAQLFFDSAQSEALQESHPRTLSAAAFVRIAGDEADALALMFILRDLSEEFDATMDLRDPDNPIAKLRRVRLHGGRLPSGEALESILVRRAIYRPMPDGSRMEMIPPRGPGSAFGSSRGGEGGGEWSFIVHDIRVADRSFLRAEAEAMRIYRGLNSLPGGDVAG